MIVIFCCVGEFNFRFSYLLLNVNHFEFDLHQILVDDAPISLPNLHSTIYSIIPFPKKRDDAGNLSCDCFTFLTPTSPVDQVEKEKDSVDEVQPSAIKVRNAKTNLINQGDESSGLSKQCECLEC